LILNKNRIHCLKYNEYNETLIEIKDTLLQKLNIYSKKKDIKIINNGNLKTNYLEIMRSCFTKI
jgi:hypothetical protein